MFSDVLDANELTAQKDTTWWYGTSTLGGTISPGDLVSWPGYHIIGGTKSLWHHLYRYI